MEQELPLKIIIPFNEKIMRSQLDFNFNYLWKKRIITYIKVFLILAIAIYFLDSFQERYHTILEYFDFLNFYFIIYFAFLFLYFIYNKLNYKDKVTKAIKEQVELGNTETIFEFTENHLIIKCNSFDIKCIWSQTSYHLFQNRLFLNFKIGAPISYIIDNNETSEYDKIVKILKEKSTKAK